MPESSETRGEPNGGDHRQSERHIRQPQILHHAQKGLVLKLDGLGEKATGICAKHLIQRIVVLIGLTKPHDVDRASIAYRSR